MCGFYILEDNSFIHIISKFIDNKIFTNFPINANGIRTLKHYHYLKLYIIETDSNIYYYIDNIDILNQIVSDIKRNIINEDIIDKENIIKKVIYELEKYKFKYPNCDNDDDYLLIEKRLYHAKENLSNIKKKQISSIFIEIETPNDIQNVFMF